MFRIFEVSSLVSIGNTEISFSYYGSSNMNNQCVLFSISSLPYPFQIPIQASIIKLYVSPMSTWLNSMLTANNYLEWGHITLVGTWGMALNGLSPAFLRQFYVYINHCPCFTVNPTCFYGSLFMGRFTMLNKSTRPSISMFHRLSSPCYLENG